MSTRQLKQIKQIRIAWVKPGGNPEGIQIAQMQGLEEEQHREAALQLASLAEKFAKGDLDQNQVKNRAAIISQQLKEK